MYYSAQLVCQRDLLSNILFFFFLRGFILVTNALHREHIATPICTDQAMIRQISRV